MTPYGQMPMFNALQQQQLLQLQQQQLLLQQQQQQIMTAGFFGIGAQTSNPGTEQSFANNSNAPMIANNSNASFTSSLHGLSEQRGSDGPHSQYQQGDPDLRCENCDKQFNNRFQLQTHLKAHKKCSQCDFEASGKLVVLHEEEVHALLNGMPIPRLPSLDTPEDIEKWIADRKKKYPTDENVRKKEAEEQEKIARGEII
ncbi:hypothetical protein HK104_008989, partial [Borealophlyctis nickersoniae]